MGPHYTPYHFKEARTLIPFSFQTDMGSSSLLAMVLLLFDLLFYYSSITSLHAPAVFAHLPAYGLPPGLTTAGRAIATTVFLSSRRRLPLPAFEGKDLSSLALPTPLRGASGVRNGNFPESHCYHRMRWIPLTLAFIDADIIIHYYILLPRLHGSPPSTPPRGRGQRRRA